MSRRSCVLVAALCGLALPALGQSPRALFDGRSLAGFEGDPRYWSVEGGELVGRSSTAQPLARTTYLLWRGGEVGDFKLEFD